MRLNSERIYIRGLEINDLHSLLDLRMRNREFVQSFEPVTPDSHYTLGGQKEILEKVKQNWGNDSGYGFGIFLNLNDQLIGRVNLSNVVRGAWQSCTMGYFLDEKQGSVRVLEKVGFRYDGYSEYYLNINGVWEEHNLYSITQERWA